jgi:hypothetical protein
MKHKMHSPAARPSGFAAVAVLFVLALVAIASLAGYMGNFALSARTNRVSATQITLDSALINLQKWYAQNPSIETNTVVLGESAFIASALTDFPSQFGNGLGGGMRAQMSAPQTSTVNGASIQYRLFAIWISPGSSDSFSWSNASGTLTPAFDPQVVKTGLYRSWSSLAFQTTQMAQLQSQLIAVQGRISSWAAGEQEIESSSESFLRAPDCNLPSGTYLACVDSYTSILATDIAATLSLAAQDVTSPWGDVLQISNLDCSTDVLPGVVCNTSSVPFTLSLRIKRPFDSTYQYLSVEQK